MINALYKKAGRLFFVLLAVYAVFAASSLFITPDRLNWYHSLPLSPLTPPDCPLGALWCGLFLLGGFSAFLTWDKASPRYFALQLVCTGLAPFMFFFLHSPTGAAAALFGMLFFLVFTIKAFYPVSKAAAFLLVPQAVLGLFLLYLNLFILINSQLP